MPELPEVRAQAERLAATHVGAILELFQPITFTALKTATPDPSAALSRPLDELTTRGKFLLLRFGDQTHVVHLMQGGRLIPDEKMSAKPRNGIARWRFVDTDALLLTEAGKERKAGVWVLSGDPSAQAPLVGLGPDADSVDLAELTAILAGTGGRLHGVLRDQHQLAGLGRRLANEICHTAKLSPFAASSKLNPDEVAQLHAAIHTCIDVSLEFERSQTAMVASAKRPAEVHNRTGEACPTCSDVVRAVEYNAYTVNYCATCQTKGKVLADNTTSKFLK